MAIIIPVALHPLRRRHHAVTVADDSTLAARLDPIPLRPGTVSARIIELPSRRDSAPRYADRPMMPAST
jgi:hypothetical protein